MARACQVCAHRQRGAIEAAIVAGQTLTSLARTYGVSRKSLAAHRDEHLPAKIASGHRAAEEARADVLWGQLNELHGFTVGILRALADGHHELIEGPFAPMQIPSTEGGVVLPMGALKAVREVRANLELLARIEGQIEPPDDRTITVVFDDEWRTGQ